MSTLQVNTIIPSTGSTVTIGESGDSLVVTTDDFVIDGSGNVGIGTSSPDDLLHVYAGDSAVTPQSDSAANFESNGSVSISLMSANGVNRYIRFDSPGSGGATYIRGLAQASPSDDRIELWAGNELCLAAKNGNVGIGTDGPGYKLEVATIGTNQSTYVASHGTGAGNQGIRYVNDSTILWSSYADGGNSRFTISNTTGVGQYMVFGTQAWSGTSDERLKENIVDEGKRLQDVLDIKVRRFDWKESGKQDLGFIAQELHEVCPEAVDVGSDDIYEEDTDDNKKGDLVSPWGVSQTALIPILTKAIQEQQEQIEELKAQVASLTNAA